MTHPSIQGLREAARQSQSQGCEHTDTTVCSDTCDAIKATNAIAAYLTKHGVGWFGEGLVAAIPCASDNQVVHLVPVPQDGES